jgi:hypothetical protein
MPRSRLVLVPLFAVLLSLLFSSSAQAYPEVGISQSYRDFGLNLSLGGSYNSDRDVSRSVSWSPLKIERVRAIVPWDLAGRAPSDGRRQEFENWLKRAREMGAHPFVVFGPSERSPSTDNVHVPAHWSNVQTRCCSPEALVAPNGTAYREAVKDFLATWGPGTTASTGLAEVRAIGAWNEPNVAEVHMAIPGGITGGVFLAGGSTRMKDIQAACSSGATATNCGPLGVAWFWVHANNAMKALCSTCNTVAGEFNSNIDKLGREYWNTYANKIDSISPSEAPKVVSFHGHHDVRSLGSFGSADCTSIDNSSCITKQFRDWLKERGAPWSGVQVWDTEVGVQHPAGTSESSDDIAQRNRFNHLMELDNKYGVSRIYYYNFQHQAGKNDRSLLDSAEGNPAGVNARRRPIWDAVRCVNTGSCGEWSNPAAVATTGAASGVTATAATISGTVLPNGLDTPYWVDYGTSTSYGQQAPSSYVIVPRARTQPASVTVYLTGLRPGTTYHYRVAANNGQGVSYGADQTFRTPDFDVRSSGVLSEGAGGVQWVYYAKDNSPVAQFFGSGSTFYNPVLNGMIQSGPLGPPARAGSVPASLREPASGEHWVYYVSSSNTIWTYWWSGTQWLAGELGGNVRPGTNVVAVRNPRDASQSVFYVNASGQIAQFYWSAAGGWKSRVLGGSVQAGSSPAAVLDPGNGIQWVYYVNSSGQIAQFYGWDDTYYPGLIGGSAAPGTSPAVIMDPENAQHWVYYVKSTGNLGEFWWNGVNAWAPEDIGLPVRAGTSPTVVRDSATTQQWVYYVKPNLELGEAWWNSQYWQSREVGGFAMAGASPSAVRDPASGYQWVSVRSSEKDTRLMEWNQSSWVPRLLQGS